MKLLATWAFLILAQPAAVTPPVTLLTGAELLRAIREAPEEHAGQQGLYSVRLASTSDYPVIGIRRTLPGKSEQHAKFADVWYVLQGAATLVTEGALVDATEISPGELRGRSISGGATRRVQAGDFAVLPAGVPHWISAVEGSELLYLVVKVPAK